MEALRVGDPTRLGPFELLGRIGAGGMGEVFLGRAEGNGQLAAVKVIHPALTSDPQFRGRFAREITTARRVRAPWTAVVLEADPNGTQPWLATEYVQGMPLDAAVAATGPLPEAAVAKLGAQLGESLAALHASGITHRDLKPSNVLLGQDGPRLIDFGIARAADATRITHTGHAIGTPAYMSPEQALGQATGPASDMFSLAAVLTFAATGVGPFGQTSNPVAMLRKVSGAAPELDAVPPALQEPLRRCLAKHPGQRPSAAELARMLAPLAATDSNWRPPAVPHPISVQQRAKRRRNLTVAAAVVTVVALLAVTGFFVARNVGGVPIAQQSSTTAPVPTTTPPPPTSIAVGVVPSRIQGWLGAASESRNVAYDVPPPWAPSSVGTIRGFERDENTKVVMSGVAERQEPPCTADDEPGKPDTQAHLPAWTGVSGWDQGDLNTAGGELAKIWATIGFEDEAQNPPKIETGQPAPVTLADGVPGMHTVTTVEAAAPGPCDWKRAAIHTVAAAANNGQSMVWMLLTDLDYPAKPSDADIASMISSIRKAGLDGKCKPEAVGSWC